MGVWKSAGKMLWAGTKMTAKATAVASVVTAKVAGKGAVATGKSVYDNRESIGKFAAGTARVTATVSVATAKVVGKGVAIAATTVYQHRDVIAGAGVGVVRGTAGAVGDLSAHVGSEKALSQQTELLQSQTVRYERLTQSLDQRGLGKPRKAMLLDSTVVGGQTLADYISMGTVPAGVQKAYELTYPNLAADHSFIDEVKRLDATQLEGFVSGVKGKLFELEYLEHLNDGHLPAGYRAVLPGTATNPGWDIAILGPDGAMREAIQLKATDSVSYVEDALKRYPNIDVVSTSEVHSHLVMLGASEHVSDSHITDQVLTAGVDGAINQAVGSMHWTPSVVSLALIAFSAYNSEGLSNYQKSKSFGERSVKSYLAYLAGGSLALASGMWGVGVIGGIGSRWLLGSGRVKRQKLAQLKELTATNEAVLRKLEVHLARRA